MLIRDAGDHWLAITQPAHALLAGEVARAWGNAAVARPDPFAEVCLGAEQHDVAWAEWDLAPAAARARPSRGELPRGAVRPAPRDLARRAAPGARAEPVGGAARLAARDEHPHAVHGSGRGCRRAEGDLVRRYLAEQRDVQDRLIAALGTTREAADRGGRRRLLPRLAVALALSRLGRAGPPRRRRDGHPARAGGRRDRRARPVAARRRPVGGRRRRPAPRRALRRRARAPRRARRGPVDAAPLEPAAALRPAAPARRGAPAPVGAVRQVVGRTAPCAPAWGSGGPGRLPPTSGGDFPRAGGRGSPRALSAV